MKKTIITVTALLCLGVPGVAVADEATDVFRARIALLADKVEHKNDVIACERANRRALVRALETGGEALVKRCR